MLAIPLIVAGPAASDASDAERVGKPFAERGVWHAGRAHAIERIRAG